MVVYSFQLKWKIIDLHETKQETEETTDINEITRYQLIPPTDENNNKFTQVETNHFMNILCEILDKRLGDLALVFNALSSYSGPSEENSSLNIIPPMPSMLSHGLALTLKYCIEDLNARGVFLIF